MKKFKKQIPANPGLCYFNYTEKYCKCLNCTTLNLYYNQYLYSYVTLTLSS